MTEQECIEVFKELLDVPCEMLIKYDSVTTEEQKKALVKIRVAEDMAIKALEKQIAKKPNKTIDSTWGIKREVHVCPVCDYYLLETHFIVGDEIKERKMVTFCDTCGQAIDWEEV